MSLDLGKKLGEKTRNVPGIPFMLMTWQTQSVFMVEMAWKQLPVPNVI
jgi:hypothetical protein